MAGLDQLVLSGLLAVIGVLLAYRLTGVLRAAATLWSASPTESPTVADGDSITLDGQAFVEESATAADRLFPDAPAVGAYVWQAGFLERSTYVYDSVRGELRKRRKPFASGAESGEFGVESGETRLYIDPSWLRERYDCPALTELEVGNPRRNISLPALVTRYLIDSAFVCLRSTVGEASVSELTDVIPLYRDDVHTDEFRIDARGVPAGQSLFVHGEIQRQEGVPTVVGTDRTPLLISDRGKSGLARALLWQATKYGVALAAVGGFLGVVWLL